VLPDKPNNLLLSNYKQNDLGNLVMQEYDVPFFANEYYHVFNRAVGSERIALDEENYRFLLEKICTYFLRVSNIHCYNILPNHFHIFLRIKDFKELATVHTQLHPGKILTEPHAPEFVLQQFGNCFNSYTKSFNKYHHRKGRLFMESLKRSLIQDDDYFTKVIHYIHANAVQHGICKSINEWPHSSYHAYLETGRSFMKKDEVLNWFGGLKGFIEFHQQPISLKFREEC
jgi:REP element-mobilizing transposase RayT